LPILGFMNNTILDFISVQKTLKTPTSTQKMFNFHWI
jgi:hypothetical protein